MKLKYIIDELGGFSIFTEYGNHDDVARGFTMKSFTEIVAAGFIEIMDGEVTCYGESISLKIKSRGEFDAEIITQHLNLKA